jgi:hypothetical protein
MPMFHPARIAFLLVLFAACHNTLPDQSPNVPLQPPLKDSVPGKPIHPDDTLVSGRFVRFAQFLDSLDYCCDTIRLKKTYDLDPAQKRISIKGYLFYLGSAESFLKEYGRDKLPADSAGSFLDNRIMGKCLSSATYFYTQKKPLDTDQRGKWFVDGLIDEWKYPNSTAAQMAAKELTSKVVTMFPNSTFLVGRIDNCLYSLTSRSSRFTSIQEKLFKHFMGVNKGVCLD